MLKYHIVKATYLSDYSVRFLFADKTLKDFDFRPYLNLGIFNELKDVNLFKKFNLENNTITWCNGEIDFAPDTIYENGVTVKL